MSYTHKANAQPKAYDAAQTDSLVLKGNKDIFIFMYTDWCRYCAAMKQTTFKNDSVVRLLEQHFYFVPFNAESRCEVNINGSVYKYAPSGAGTGLHELAVVLSGKTVPAFPFIAVINKKGEVVFSYDSYLSAKELIAVLNSLIPQKQ